MWRYRQRQEHASRVRLMYTSDQYPAPCMAAKMPAALAIGQRGRLADGERRESQRPPEQRDVLGRQSAKDERQRECCDDWRESAVVVDVPIAGAMRHAHKRHDDPTQC